MLKTFFCARDQTCCYEINIKLAVPSLSSFHKVSCYRLMTLFLFAYLWLGVIWPKPPIYLNLIFTILQFEISSLINWIFSLFQTWILQAIAGRKIQFKLGKKSSSSNLISQTGELQKSSANRLGEWLCLITIVKPMLKKTFWLKSKPWIIS